MASLNDRNPGFTKPVIKAPEASDAVPEARYLDTVRTGTKPV